MAWKWYIFVDCALKCFVIQSYLCAQFQRTFTELHISHEFKNGLALSFIIGEIQGTSSNDLEESLNLGISKYESLRFLHLNMIHAYWTHLNFLFALGFEHTF